MDDDTYASIREQILKAVRSSGSAHALTSQLVGTPQSIWKNIRVRSVETMPTLYAMCAFAHGVFLANKEAGTKLFDTLIRSLNTLDAVGKNSSGVTLLMTDGPYALYFMSGSLTDSADAPAVTFYNMVVFAEETVRLTRGMNGAVVLFGLGRAADGAVDALEWSVHT